MRVCVCFYRSSWNLESTEGLQYLEQRCSEVHVRIFHFLPVAKWRPFCRSYSRSCGPTSWLILMTFKFIRYLNFTRTFGILSMCMSTSQLRPQALSDCHGIWNQRIVLGTKSERHKYVSHFYFPPISKCLPFCGHFRIYRRRATSTVQRTRSTS